ncbi:MAG TPA: ShlB/FhaC/HecB family hemolysin secretion/activation protein [Limnochordia bacterium]|nr:ShlB/FhaC/HecB family hemolysin secretion/activation protein [Limnochordia bacterium]
MHASADLAQALSPRATLQLHLQAQIASKNLDASERMALGGPDGVRGYDAGEAAGDQGWLARAELSRTFVLPGWRGRTALALFWDGGGVEVNRDPWSGAGQAGWITLGDAGAGLDWQLHTFALKLRAAHPLGPGVIGAQPPPPWRVWLQSSWAW